MNNFIKLRDDFEIDDEDFNMVYDPFNNKLVEWFHNRRDIIDEFIAFYTAHGIKDKAIWTGSFEGLVNSAIETLSGLLFDEYLDRKNFDKILADKYGYQLVQDNPMLFKKIK